MPPICSQLCRYVRTKISSSGISKRKGLIINYIPGHSVFLHSSVLIRCPSQGFPPKADCCSSYLSCVIVPFPHVTEQGVHSFHADHLQSTMMVQKYSHRVSLQANVRADHNIPEQSLNLQVSNFWGESQDLPPLADSCSTDLSCDLEPSPHVLEQDDHSFHADQTQSTTK